MGTYRKVENFNQLQRGTIIRHVLNERTFVVTGNYGNRAIAVASVDVTNLSEWLAFDDSEHSDSEERTTVPQTGE